MELELRAWDKKLRQMFLFDELEVCNEYNLLGFHWQGNHGYGDLEIEKENIEVMQYIGIPDSKGQKIFDGDIISNGFSIFIVKNNLYEFYAEDIKEYDGRKFIRRFHEFRENITVIGNKWENPELWKDVENA